VFKLKAPETLITTKPKKEIPEEYCLANQLLFQIFTAIVIFGGFNLSNWAFGLLRSQQQQTQSHHQQQPNDFVPQTPHRVISNGYIQDHDNYPPPSGNYKQGYQQNWQQLPPYQQQHAPYQSHTPYSQRHIEAPPLVHAHTMPALPSTAQEGVSVSEGGKTPRKRGLFR
jgi:hypothetical protein